MTYEKNTVFHFVHFFFSHHILGSIMLLFFNVLMNQQCCWEKATHELTPALTTLLFSYFFLPLGTSWQWMAGALSNLASDYSVHFPGVL